MYYPFLRAKQFDLLALRELSPTILNNSEKISPIIEPVKDSSTLKTTIIQFVKNNVNFNFIINPTEGDLKGKESKLLELCSLYCGEYKNYQVAIIIEENTDLNYLRDLIENSNQTNNISLIYYFNRTDTDEINTIFSDFNIKNNIIYFDKIRSRYISNFDNSLVISLFDPFESQVRNSDYLAIDESEFSDDYLFYKKEGLKGFSDYLTIGDKYSDSGYSPYAIAIHITYLNRNKLYIKHFVSDSNIDTSDVAGKFYEALNKLIDWNNTVGLNTQAMNEFQNLHIKQHFPGLGSLKKLSIMNHIEIINRTI